MLNLCEHQNYNCYICEVKLLKHTIEELEKQNKLLIAALEEIKDEEWRLAGEFTTIYTTAYLALQQIQGNKP